MINPQHISTYLPAPIQQLISHYLTLQMDYIWKVHDDPCDSGHFSIILESTQPIHDNNWPPSWKTNKANWQQSETLCHQRLVQETDCKQYVEMF